MSRLQTQFLNLLVWPFGHSKFPPLRCEVAKLINCRAVTNLSIATACIPCLKPFLSSMRSGVFNTALPAGFEGGLTYTLESSQQGLSGNHSVNKSIYGAKKTPTSKTVVESVSVLERSESETRLTAEDRIYKTTEYTIDNSEVPQISKGFTN